MKIVSLKYDEPETTGPEPCDYPYSMRLTLNGFTLDKLGLDKLPNVGEVIEITGMAVVVAVRNDGLDRSIELQITDLGTSAAAKTPAEKLYDKT